MSFIHRKIYDDLSEELATIGIAMGGRTYVNESYNLSDEDSDVVEDVIKIYEGICKICKKYVLHYGVLGENTTSHSYYDGRKACIGIMNEASDWLREMKKYIDEDRLNNRAVRNFCKHSYGLSVELMTIINKTNN